MEELRYQILNVRSVNDIKQTTIPISEPLVHERSSEAEIAAEKLRLYKSQGTDQIPAEVIHARGNILR
jgi:hypothetical protein